MIEYVLSCRLCHTSRPFGLFMHPHAAAADPSCEGRLPVCVTVRFRDIVAAPRAAHRCPTLRAHQLPIAPPAATAAVRRTRQRRVSRQLRVTPVAAPPPAPATSHRADADTPFAVCRGPSACRPPLPHPPRPPTCHPTDAETSCVVAASRDAHRCPIPRGRLVPSRRCGDAVCRGRSA